MKEIKKYLERTIILSPGRRTGRLTVCHFS